MPAALPAPGREKMSSVDSAWLRMDSPANLMMIVAVLMFERPLETGRFRRSPAERLLSYCRLRAARDDPGQPAQGWEKLVPLAANPLSYSLMMGVFSRPQDI